MSIREVISARVAEGALVELKPALPSDPHRRHMFLSQEINELVAGPWKDQKWANRCNRLKANLEEFVKGEILPVSLTPYAHDAAYMGRLDRPIDEVWDIRSRDPRPGMRVLGRFSEFNTFVALHWGLRKDFPDRQSWRFAIAKTKGRWNRLLSPYDPPFYGGSDLNAYLDDNAYVV
jgi:hypothetical protein